MGLFSNICSAISSGSTENESPKTLRKEHGVNQFDAEMKRLRNFNPTAELVKADASIEGNNSAVEQA